VIFVTVGTQGPFERLIRAVDRWAARAGASDVLAQIGPGSWRPAHVRWTETLAPEAYRRAFEEAEIVVAHAGIGTLVTALELGKALVVMPRLASQREHRNDHQVATAEHFCRQHGVRVATDDQELARALDELRRMATKELVPVPRILAPSSSLLKSVREFIEARP
jgi:UDP-N-acetylglucosamine transferase subunit ALG13